MRKLANNYYTDKTKSVTISANSSATLLSVRWVKQPGAIRRLGLGVQNQLQWPTAKFDITIDGMPVPDYGVVQDDIGAIRDPVEVYIPVGAASLIEIKATNGANAGGLFAARLMVMVV